MAAKADSVQIVNGRLIVDMAIPEVGKLSTTGKSNVHLSIGHMKLDNGFALGLNLYKKA